MFIDGNLWINLDPLRLIIDSYVAEHNGYEINLPDQHWIEFGAALKCFHLDPGSGIIFCQNMNFNGMLLLGVNVLGGVTR